jgi:hypothetical protein
MIPTASSGLQRPADVLAYDPESAPSLLYGLTRLPTFVYRVARWSGFRGNWLRDHLRRHRPFSRRRVPADRPIDMMVLVTDHFEPARRFGDDAAYESVRSWCADYEALAEPHRDSDGRPPQHTWFYRYDYPNPRCVQELGESAFRGFGEVEFHLHHGYDTHASFARTLADGVAWFNQFGAMLTAENQPQNHFGYIAGNWALDDGANDPSKSGCPTEIAALRDAGCYADFTFPSLGTAAQPRKTNAIYYATEDGKPKSYDTGVDLACGRPPSGDLLMFQGPVSIDWRNGCIQDGAVEDYAPAHPRRLAGWLSAHVHVRGRPEWVFVKLHTHAMQNRKSFLGPAMDQTLTAMEHWWKRPPFRLHYVTAREAYNIAKAAEAGHSGDPDDFRDFLIGPPANRVVCCSSAWRLRSCSARRVHLEVLERQPTRVAFATGDLRSVSGIIREVEATYRDGCLVSLCVEADGPVAVEPAKYASLAGAAHTQPAPALVPNACPVAGSFPGAGTETNWSPEMPR